MGWWLVLALGQGLGEPNYKTLKTLGELATTTRTHVCVVGPVVYVRSQKDGDIHITLDDGRAKAVLEIVPKIPLARPKKGTRIEACGVSRYDKGHRWFEVHPVYKWQLVGSR